MEVFEILREYDGIDLKISSEIKAIQAGKDFAQELFGMLRECPDDSLTLNSALNSLRKEMHDREMSCLMEYRRLTILKISVLLAFNQLPERAVAVLRARACDERSWEQIATSMSYSVSQVKRFYQVALKKFAEEYKDGR